MARIAVLAFPLILSSLLLAGCASDDPVSEVVPCAGVDATTNVPAWTKHGGDWGSLANGAGHEGVVCGVADKALSSLVRDEGTFTNLEASVSFNMIAGDSGAGLVVHFQDEQNFNIVRYSIREQGWHLFTVVEGNRQKQNEASVEPPTTNPDLGMWVALRVTSMDGHILAYDGTTLVIDYMLNPEASHAGAVGYFLRDTDMAAFFDDFTVKAT